MVIKYEDFLQVFKFAYETVGSGSGIWKASDSANARGYKCKDGDTFADK